MSGAGGDEASTPPARRGGSALERLSGLGASAQAAIPGLYAWAITVAPAAWTRGAPSLAKVLAIVGLVALTTAPLVEGGVIRPPRAARPDGASGSVGSRTWSGPTWARIWSVWGLVLSSASVWALSPAALSSARLDPVRGALGLVGWGLFAFASAGPALRSDPDDASRIIAGSALKPRSEIPRGDGVYVAIGVLVALGMQLVGWGVQVPERAVLVRLVTVTCGIAVLGAMTSIALARHAVRVPASRRLRMRRASPWLLVLALAVGVGVVLAAAR